MAATKKAYQGPAYWEKEKPQTEVSGRTAFMYYAKAGKLQVSSTWLDVQSGERRRGHTVTLDRQDLQASPDAAALLERVLAEWKSES